MLTALALSLLSAAAPGPAADPAPSRALAPTLARPARAEDLDEGLQRLGSALVPALVELAGEAQKERAFHVRNDLYRLVLRFEPDHEEARRFLGYKWDRKAEEWVLPRDPRPAKDAKEDAVPPLLEKRDAILGGYRDGVLALVDGDPELPLRRRNRVLADLLELLPDDATLHGRMGHVRDPEAPDSWVLTETLVARKQRAQGRERLRAYKEGVGDPNVSDLSGWESELGRGWKLETHLDGVRITGDVGEREQTRIARAVHVARSWVGYVFEDEVLWDLERWVLEDIGPMGDLLDELGVAPERKQLMIDSRGVMLGRRAGVTAAQGEDARLDACVRYTANGIMNGRFGTSVRQGWAHEGFGMYFTHQVVGTRLTYFIRVTEYTEGRGKRPSREMRDDDANWFQLARRVLAEDDPPYNLAFALGRDVNTMTADDLLVGYALAGYLLEGHPPGVAERVLTGIGQDQRSSVEVLEEVLGYDPYTLVGRLERWLEETGR